MSRKLIIFLLIIAILASFTFFNFNSASISSPYPQHLLSPKEDIEKTGFNKDGSLTTHLPIIIIKSNGQDFPGHVETDRRKLKCSYDIIDNEKGMNTSNAAPTLSGYMEISIRGNSSRYLPKKQYSIKLVEKESDKAHSEMLLGMPKGTTWVLNGSYIDKSLIRNYMLLNVSGEIMNYSPRCRLCEVMITGADGKAHYEGVYTLIEKPKVDKNRVNLSLYNPKFVETSYMVQMNRAIDHKVLYHLKPDDMFTYYFDLEYPNSLDITPQSLQYIQNDLLKFEKSLYDALHTQNWNNVEKYIDIKQFVDYYIINEFFQNYDAGTLSTYLYKNMGKKLSIGPVWDFDSAFNNYRQPTELHALKLDSNYFFYFLSQDPNFSRMCTRRYLFLRNTVLSEKNLIDYIDSISEYLGSAADRNADRWYKGDKTLFTNDIEKMKKYVKERGAWMDDNFVNMSKVVIQEGNK